MTLLQLNTNKDDYLKLNYCKLFPYGIIVIIHDDVSCAPLFI